ncbi:MAG: NADH-quinone oxidoreductase subunit C [Deltaproteobacteria bacterium]|jgi:NADH-quinone oxidoreductase subunit C|nr:NADH-quinone oxidoreductase subunit C [Deltaproteobacteria bacterium]
MDQSIDEIKKEIGEDVIEISLCDGEVVLKVESTKWKDVVDALKDKCKFDMLIDLCAVDYRDGDERFEVVVHLYGLGIKKRIRVKSRCSGEIQSVCDIYPAANWFEREAYDLFGIHFEGHPNLKRILCHDNFEGHPLRKDFDKRKRSDILKPNDLMDEM